MEVFLKMQIVPVMDNQINLIHNDMSLNSKV